MVDFAALVDSEASGYSKVPFDSTVLFDSEKIDDSAAFIKRHSLIQ